MKKEERELLNLIIAYKQPVNAKKLAVDLNSTEDQIKKKIRKVNDQVGHYGAKIVGKPGYGNGYELKIENDVLFNKYLKEDADESRANEEDFGYRDVRIRYIIRTLLEDGYISKEDLLDELNVSFGQLNKDVALVRLKLQKYGLDLQNVPPLSIRLVGGEREIRRCYSRLKEKEYDDNDLILETIKEIIIRNSKEFGYRLTDFTCLNLTTHLYIAFERSYSDNSITIGENIKNQLVSKKEFELAKAIMKDINERLDADLPEDEVYFCAMHLCAKRLEDNQYIINEEIGECINEMFELIKEDFGIDFSNNINMVLRLSMHTVPLISRINYKLELENPLLNDIKHNYFLAYEIAADAAKVINRRYRCVLSESEIAYLAIHFRLGMEEMEEQKNKYKILLICSTGRGSAELLKNKIRNTYGQYISQLDTSDLMHIKDNNPDNYDFIFSTVPFSNEEISKPVIFISYFLTTNESIKIKAYLEKKEDIESSKRFFRKELFLGTIEAETRDEMLKKMIDQIKKNIDLSDTFLQEVIERESIASTNFGSEVAFPHSLKMSDKTFIAVAVPKRPLVWFENEKVQIVMLASFEKNFARENEEFFSMLNRFMGNKEYIRKLVKTPDYETLISIIDEIEGEN